MKIFSLFLLPTLFGAATLVPEFVVTTEGHKLADKVSLTGSVNRQGEVVLSWLDGRDSEEYQFLNGEEWPQVYMQHLSGGGTFLGGNAHIEMGGDYFWSADTPAVLIFNDGSVLTAVGRINSRERRKEKAVLRLWDSAEGFEGSPMAEYEVGLFPPTMLATDGDSLCVAVGRVNDTGRALAFRLFTRTGTLLGEPVKLDTGDVENNIIMDSRGNFVVGYRVGSPYTGGNLYYRRYDSKGNPLGEKVKVSENGLYLSLAGDPDSKLLACWLQGTPVFSRAYSPSDQPEGPVQKIGEISSLTGGTLAVAQGYGGWYLAVWSKDDTLYGRLIDAAGVPQGNAFRINEPRSGLAEGPWVGGEPERYHVAWVEYDFEDTCMVYTTTVAPSGTVARPERRVCDDEPGAGSEWNEALLASNGEFFVFWRGGKGAYIRPFSAQGEPLGNTCGDTLKSANPAIGLDGKLYLSYCTIGQDNVKTIWLQRFDEKGLPLGAPIEMGRSETPRGIWGTAVAADKDGNGVVVWEEWVGPYYAAVRLWGQRFSSTGSKLGRNFIIDSLYTTRGGLRAFMFEDGGFIVGVKKDLGSQGYNYFCHFYDSEGKPERDTLQAEPPQESNTPGTMAANGKDRFVVLWLDYSMNYICLQVYDRKGVKVGEPYHFYPPRFQDVTSLNWRDYYPAVSMAPDGRFVITWETPDEAGNLNLWGQTFSRDGKPLSAPFQVNDPDQWPYSFQFSGWRGVSAQDDRILFTWLENRRHRGWDVIAKVTDWDFPGVEEKSEPASPIKLSASLNRLSYSVPGQARLSLYSVDGRKVLEELVQGEGVWSPASLPSGFYFVNLLSDQSTAKSKLLVLH